MALSIKDPETERLVRELASLRNTGVTSAVRVAVANELEREKASDAAQIEQRVRAIQEITEEFSRLPVIDPTANADEWMYDENGLPH